MNAWYVGGVVFILIGMALMGGGLYFLFTKPGATVAPDDGIGARKRRRPAIVSVWGAMFALTFVALVAAYNMLVRAKYY